MFFSGRNNMVNIKLSTSRKVTIAGVTLFSAIILGGLSTTNVDAATDQPATNQVVGQNNDQIDTGTISSGTKEEPAPDTGSGTGSDSGQIDSNTDTGKVGSGSDSGTGAAGSGDTGNITKSSGTIGNNSSENINAYAADAPVDTATQVPVADSQGNVIDWNNSKSYEKSGYNSTSGMIINYSVESDDGNGASTYKFLKRGQTVITGNPGEKVDLTGALPQGYVLDDSNQLTQEIGDSQGEKESDSDYIKRITKDLLVKVDPNLTNEHLLEMKYEIDLYDQSQELIAVNAYPSLYFEFKKSLVSGNTMKAYAPIGFQFIVGSNTIQNLVEFSVMGQANPNARILKDNKSTMSNEVNFKNGSSIVSATTVNGILGSSSEVNAPTGYTFSDGSTTKNITIGAASPMYMAYYGSIGINKDGGANNIDPSVHEIDVVKAPVIVSKKTVDLTVSNGTTWNPDTAYDSENSTDANDDPIPYANLTVTIQKVGSETPETVSEIDQSKPGQYTVTYAYNGYSTVTSVTVTQAPELVVQPSSVHVNSKTWDPATSLVRATDENGKDISLSDITVDSSALKLDTPGTYDVTFKYGGIVKTTQVIVTDSTIINVHNSTIHVGDTWTPADNFDNATDSNGNSVDFSEVTEKDNVDTKTPGTYKATYTLNGFSKDATITVLANATTDPSTPSTDKEWLINAPYLVKADNYTQIYSSPSTSDPVVNRQLVHDSDWMVGLAVQNSEGTFYQVSTNEWVKAGDMWAFKPIADVVYANDPSNTAVFSTVDEAKDTDINLSYQTAWLVDRVAVDDAGNTWYRVGTSNYVKASDITKDAPETSYRGTVQLAGTGNVPLYNLDYYGNIKHASRTASSGTNWISNNHRELNGTIYHQISNSEWVSEIDSVFTKQD